MALPVWEFVSVLVTATTTGMFHGPWLALTRSIRTFPPDLFLAIVHRLTRNMAPVMTVLLPGTLLSMVPVLILSYGDDGSTFALTLTALALFIVAAVVTMAIEVPIVQRIATWTVTTLPPNWQQQRDRWGSFHVVRVAAALAGLAALVAGAIFS